MLLSRNVVRAGACLALILAGMPSVPAQGQPAAPAAAAKNKTTPAFDAFVKAWDGVDNYHEQIVTHETTNDGKQTQDRTYDYKFKKPSNALIQIVDGPGKGGGAAWRGGDKVKGHQGGLFSGLKMMIGIHDPRATDLRGDTLEVASFGWEINHYLTTPGTLGEAAGPTIDGTATTAVTLIVNDPTATNGVSKDVLAISNANHLPVRREQFVGSLLVKTEDFKNIQLNPGIKIEDIDL